MEHESFLYRKCRFFIELNLFETVATDEHSVRIQRWSTRLYIFVLTTAMIILLAYTTLNVMTKQIEVQNPSLLTYFNLYNKYGNVRCRCTQIALSYRAFVELSPLYHQVCRSDFISQKWIDFLFDNNMTMMRYAVDFRASASNQFQVLRELCQISYSAIDDALETFYKSKLISGDLFNKDLFNAQLNADILAFQSVTILNFRRSLIFMRSFIAGNAFMPAIQTAFRFVLHTDSNGYIIGK
jgi:hypothetical protein